MAIPSSLYAEDENARQTLANGTVLKWTKKNSGIYTAPNLATDRSICYCNWKGELDYANRGFHQWQGGCATGDDLGHNGCEGAGFENLHANSLKQNEFGQPRIEGIYTGVVLTDSDGDGAYVWGYNPEKSECINSGNGADRRYLLDMDINKMIFNITINVYDKADFDAIDYINSNNPESYQLPRVHNITLKQLYENPDDYYVESFNWGKTYVYGENTSDHWRGAQVYPAHIINSDTVGQFKGTRNLGIFGMHYATGSFSYDNSNPMNPNAHPTFGGGGSTPVIYNNMNNGYFMACGKDINLNPVYSYSAVGTSAESIAQYKWGTSTSWNHNAYVNQEFFDYGGSVIWCAYGAHAYYNSNTSESKYREYFFFTRKMLKGQYALDYIASFGLYFAGETFDPDSVNLTPETLGDDNRIMLGEMSADGTTTGRWITDIDSYHGPNKDGKTNNPTYDPTGGGGGTDGDDIDDHKMGAGSQLSGIAQLWLLTRSQLKSLHNAFSSAPPNYDPMSSFISVMGLGISALRVVGDSMPWTLNPINIRMSNGETWHTGVEAHIVDSQVSAFNELNLRVKRKYNNFLDYSPYATHEIFLPMCGWITLPDIAVDRPITVTYIPDIETLKIRAVVSVVDDSGNRCVVGEKDGVMGAEIPFTNIGHSLFLGNTIVQSADIAGEIVTGAIGAGFTKTTSKGATYRPYEGFTVGMAGTLPGAIGNALVSGNINRTHFTTGNGSRVGFGDGENIQIKSTYHRIDKPNNYDHTVGKVCNKTGQLSGFTGFTVCDNPHINFSATEREKEEIKQLLEQGVIL